MKRALNAGILPPDHYALAEQVAGEYGPDVLTLESPVDSYDDISDGARGGIALAEAQPKVSFRAISEDDEYAAKAYHIAIRHVSGDRMVAIIEIVSPGNKSSRAAVRTFAEKAAELLRRGIHLLIIDLFPPSARDPQGIHKVIWDEFQDSDFNLPANRTLTLASYVGGARKEAFVEPIAMDGILADMPLFLSPEFYVPVPLDATYASAWEAVPRRWQSKLASPHT